jgi:hypothetical protein
MKLPKLSRTVIHNPNSKFDLTASNLVVLPAGFGGNPCDNCIDRCLNELGGSPDLCRFGPCRTACGVNG